MNQSPKRIPSGWRHYRLSVVFVVSTLCFVIGGCFQQKFENISESREASSIVGREFASIQSLVVHGVTSDPNYRGGVTYYAVKKPPGSSGPEILERFTLPAGTHIKIVRVLRCTNCLFGNNLIAEIKSNGLNFSGKPTRLVDLLRIDKRHGQIALDEQYFRDVEEAEPRGSGD